MGSIFSCQNPPLTCSDHSTQPCFDDVSYHFFLSPRRGSLGANATLRRFSRCGPSLLSFALRSQSGSGQTSISGEYAVWIPEGAERLEGLVVHQHGCGEGSCKSGLTGAWDLHWQALVQKHKCALLALSYEQPQKANCQLRCDPGNGSSEAFLQALKDLGKISSHPELGEVPWALWGHSGGGHWAGGMTLLYPERVVACWLRSGVPLL